MQRVNVYRTANSISLSVCEAFAEGCNGKLVSADKLLPGPVATYGILRGTGEIIKECNEGYYYIDLGYFTRSTHYNNDFTGYYRVTLDANQCNGTGNHSNERWRVLNIKMKPWRSGKTIIICPLSKYVGNFLDISPSKWLRETVDEIIKHTDRPVIIKPKDSDQSLQQTLKDAHCIVAYNSNALVDAVLYGVPVFHMGPSCVEPVGSTDLSTIDNPVTPDREQWAYNLAGSQWTLEEMRSGKCWEELNE